MSDDIYDGGPAFPCKAHPRSAQDVAFNVPPPLDHLGLSLRDYLAAHAPAMPEDFQRKITKLHWSSDSEEMGPLTRYKDTFTDVPELHATWISRWRYAYADAMLLERAK